MYDYSSDENDEPEYVPISLRECGKCGRKFNTEALTRHQKICAKVNKPRKTFDSSKQRLEEFKDITVKSSPSSNKPAKKKDFRQQHEEFIKTIRAARHVTHAQKTGGKLPPPPSPTFNPDYIQCQYCNRRFAESAAERHIDFCKEQKSRLPKQPSDAKYSQKSEKQKIRTQYRPPLPGQKKKSVDSAGSPAKPRGYASSPGSKPGSSPSGTKRNIPQLDKKTKSDNSISRKASEKANYDDRPLNNNSRYKTNTRVSSGSDNEKPRSGNNRTGDPKWFEDLKRQGSGNQRKLDDEVDSGMDLNDNFTGRYSGKKKNPVGVVRPSSRSNENDLHEEREVSAGRRKKMANFCHDCGTKYPVLNAKFCCECGVRRMALT